MMSEQNKHPLTTESEIIQQKSKQLDQLERESDEERPGNPVRSDVNAAEHDEYGPQDQFGDIDGRNPYSNLDQQDSDTRPESEEDRYEQEMGLYGLAEPLAHEGEVSHKGREKNRFGTRRSQDQQGYQQ